MSNILVTGGSGSFGTAFARRLLDSPDPPNRLVIYSRGEHAHARMQQEFDHPALRLFIGDVRDLERLKLAMRGIDTVIHAAALKVIPICEYNPFEAVHTNIIGAENVCKASLATGVQRVLALSTDKACSPINVYGASKLAAEKIFIGANNLSGDWGPRFAVTRYGNVLGSQGSVIPLFKALAAQGKPLPITHSDMSRFCMTMAQALDFVLDALRDMQGREIYVPRLPSAYVTDIARAIYPEADLKHIGIRDGEKLHETLLTKDEARFAYGDANRFVIAPHIKSDLPSAFEYRSDTNDWWLNTEDLKELIRLV